LLFVVDDLHEKILVLFDDYSLRRSSFPHSAAQRLERTHLHRAVERSPEISQ
jgi:hypothetical protein